MKRRFTTASTTTVTEDGKETTIAYCDICGKSYKTDYGYKVELAYYGNDTAGRIGLCGACAGKVSPIIEKALDDAKEKEQELRAKATEDGNYRKSPIVDSLLRYDEREGNNE